MIPSSLVALALLAPVSVPEPAGEVVGEPAEPAAAAVESSSSGVAGPSEVVAATPPQTVLSEGPRGFQASGYYLHVSPGLLAVDLRDSTRRFYAWGIGGGRVFRKGSRLAVGVGGFFEDLHTGDPIGKAVPTTRGANIIRLGSEVRIGGVERRVFGYGLVRVAFDLLLRRDVLGGHVLPGFHASVGPGIQAALGRRSRFILGFEPAIDVRLVEDAELMFRVRIFGGWRW